MKFLRQHLERRPMVTAIVFTVLGVLPLYLTAALSVRLKQDLGFSTSQYGLVIAAFYLVSSIASRRLGPFLDRSGPTIGFRFGSVFTILAAGWVGLGASDWIGLASGMAVAGLANACGQIASNLVIARVVQPRRHGFTFAAKQASVPVGAMLAGAALPWMGDRVDWRVAYLVVALLAAVTLTASPRFVLEPTKGTISPRTMTAALAVFLVAAGIAGGIGNSLASFVSDAAVTTGLSQTSAAQVFTLGSALAVVVRLAIGAVADRRQGSGAVEAVSLLAVAALGFGILALTQASGAFVVGALLAFAGAWGWQGVMFYAVVRIIPLPPATSTGAVAAGVYAGTMTFPPIIGLFVERASYSAVFAVAAIGMVVAGSGIAISTTMAVRKAAVHGNRQ